MELGSCQVGCWCTKVTFSYDFFAANSDSDSVCFSLLGTDVADGPKVCWGDMLGICFPLDKETGPSTFDLGFALGDPTPLILV